MPAKKCKLVECCAAHVTQDNLFKLEIDFIVQIQYKIVFVKKHTVWPFFSNYKEKT